MQQHVVLTRISFENALTPERLRITRLMQFAVMNGAMVFVLAVMFVFTRMPHLSPRPEQIDIVNILTIVHLAYAVMAPFLGFFLFDRIFSPERCSGSPDDDAETLAARCVSLQRMAILGRLAVMEGAAFFGIVVCAVAAINGVLAADPNYWVNLLSTLVFLAVGSATFPSKERLVSWFESRFQKI